MDITNDNGYELSIKDDHILKESNNITLSFFTDQEPLFKSCDVSRRGDQYNTELFTSEPWPVKKLTLVSRLACKRQNKTCLLC